MTRQPGNAPQFFAMNRLPSCRTLQQEIGECSHGCGERFFDRDGEFDSHARRVHEKETCELRPAQGQVEIRIPSIPLQYAHGPADVMPPSPTQSSAGQSTMSSQSSGSHGSMLDSNTGASRTRRQSRRSGRHGNSQHVQQEKLNRSKQAEILRDGEDYFENVLGGSLDPESLGLKRLGGANAVGSGLNWPKAPFLSGCQIIAFDAVQKLLKHAIATDSVNELRIEWWELFKKAVCGSSNLLSVTFCREEPGSERRCAWNQEGMCTEHQDENGTLLHHRDCRKRHRRSVFKRNFEAEAATHNRRERPASRPLEVRSMEMTRHPAAAATPPRRR